MKLNKYIGGFFAILAVLLSVTTAFASDDTNINNPVIVQCGTHNYTFSGYFDEPDEDNSGSDRKQYRLAIYLDNVIVYTKDSGGNWSSSHSITVGNHAIKAQIQRRTSSNFGNSWTSWSDYGNDSDTDTFTVQACPSPTPVPASVNVCHKDGNSGNYSHISVSVHSVNDANGLNGHGNHNGDIWAPFTYNNVNYSGQGDYNGYNLVTCVPNSTPAPTGTPVPTGTSQPSWTPTASPTIIPSWTPTAVPTEDPCGGECNIPTETPVATETPNSDLCANIEGIQYSVPEGKHLDASNKNCVEFGVPGVEQPTNTGTGTGGGQVLGASTMAGTGAVSDALFNSMFTLGSLLTSFGIMKNGKKKA